MQDVILKVRNINKRYRLGSIGTKTLLGDFSSFWYRLRGMEDPNKKLTAKNQLGLQKTSDYIWALKNINFDVYRGEVIGIIGMNGAGKSTLLKILSRVTSPTHGTIKSRGRIASLLEVGTGFHPEMTGRENIYLNGAILGMTKNEITKKLKDIINFSGCERYIDTPVKRYSSGMTVRLAFSVAAFLDPDILVVDEVLAVGDAEFQKKAIGKINEISSEERKTVLFVSHDLSAISALCGRTMVIEQGMAKIYPNPLNAIQAYLYSKSNLKINNPNIRTKIPPTKGPKILDCTIFDEKNNLKQIFDGGELINFKVRIQPDHSEMTKFSVVCFVHNSSETLVAVSSSGKMNGIDYNSSDCENLSFQLNSTPFIPGDYFIRLVLHVPGEDNYDDWSSCMRLTIIKHDILKKGFQFNRIWNPQLYAEFKWS